MSQQQQPVANPFALLMDPQSIFRAIEKSERLERLHSRICRPLDKPLLPVVAADEACDAGIGESEGSSIDELDLPGEEI
ncbi:MAG TPA: hypothetical protein PKB14_01405 [Rubrivivax sp.]|nr:hypothetical protein [Rubrivivax sp.]